jgi:hypothetical protein
VQLELAMRGYLEEPETTSGKTTGHRPTNQPVRPDWWVHCGG